MKPGARQGSCDLLPSPLGHHNTQNKICLWVCASTGQLAVGAFSWRRRKKKCAPKRKSISSTSLSLRLHFPASWQTEGFAFWCAPLLMVWFVSDQRLLT